jgi:hypothetical protein
MKRRSASRIVVAAVSAVSLACLIGGCSTKRNEATTAPTRVQKNGLLVTDALPLTLNDLKKYKAGTPAAAVMELFFYAQWGSSPNVASMYDPGAVRAVGIDNLVGTYSAVRPSLNALQLRVLTDRTDSVGGFVAVEGRSREADPVRYSFELRNSGGRWRVVFDTLLEGALPSYVQDSLDPEHPGSPSSRARRAGIRVASDYRVYYARTQGR